MSAWAGSRAAPEGEGTMPARKVPRVAHLVSHPVQYYAPLYRELARREAIDLTVFFYSAATIAAYHDPGFGRTVRWDRELLDGYRARFCPSASRTPAGGGWRRRPNWDVVRAVSGGDFDAVWLHGYNHPTSLLAAAAARARGAALLIRDDQTLLHPRRWWRRAAKALVLRALFRRATGLYVGAQSRRHFAHYGIPAERLVAAPHCVDNDFFQSRAEALRPQRRALRQAFGVLDDAPVVLFSGKLIPKKQPLALLDAYARVRRERPCWLLMVGEGGERAGIEERVARHGLPGVRLAGFLNQSELPTAYAAADLLVLPSGWDETWGLVVNEALNFSLPVIVSDRVGCAEDLVRPGWNGFVVDHADVGALARAIGTLVAEPGARTMLGARGRTLVDGYSVERCADGIEAACRRAVAPSREAAA
ncbi:MAG TPA: glycosyltransferase family 4 protein [Kofleriaceae bacterium]|nr:glycosyltransferase family 4 protein [Kofleriaceae bacterium]